MKRVDRVEARNKLPLRRDPYWQRLSEGRYLGFRRMTSGTPGTWLARAYDGAHYVYATLDGIDQLADKERYDAAKTKAEEWFKHIDAGGSTEALTVKCACVAYVDHQRQEEGEQAGRNAEGFFNRLVYSDPIAKIELSKLKVHHVEAWRKRVIGDRDMSVVSNRSSFNRNITPVRAALNLAHRTGKVASDQPWLLQLEALDNATNRRTLYLDRDDRRELVAKSSEEARPLFASLNMLPMRPGEVAALKVENLKAGQRSLEIPISKTECRVIPLPDDAVSYFKQCAKGKLPGAWLVSRADGSQWKKEAWRDEIKVAARKAKLPRATVAYTLRHSLITDLVTGGLDLFHVAKLAGTSVAMIEKHYGHLQNDHARKALEKLTAMN